MGHLLEALEVLAHLRVKLVRQEVAVLAVDDVLLPVDEPVRDLELSRVLHDRDDALKLVRVELTGAVDDVAPGGVEDEREVGVERREVVGTVKVEQGGARRSRRVKEGG